MQSLDCPNLYMENTGALVVLSTVGVTSRICTCRGVFQRSLKYTLGSTHTSIREVPLSGEYFSSCTCISGRKATSLSLQQKRNVSASLISPGLSDFSPAGQLSGEALLPQKRCCLWSSPSSRCVWGTALWHSHLSIC